MLRRLAAIGVLLGLWIAPFGSSSAAAGQGAPGATSTAPEPMGGAILAPVARQAGWLNLDAPRPGVLTRFLAPSYVADVAVSTGGVAVIAVQSALPAQDSTGGDLMLLDLASGSTTQLLTRADSGESFDWPFWAPDGSLLFFQRDDQRSPPIAYAGQAAVRYPSRIEAVQPDGSARRLVVDDARQPASSPDGSQLAFVRSSVLGTALLVRPLIPDRPDEHELVPAGRFPDVAYPRFSPRGDQIAFMAAVPVYGNQPIFGWFFGAELAYAHGLPWDVWLMGSDGTNPHQLAALGGDDASLSWSPDGSQLFIYGGSGSFLVDAATGEVSGYPYLAGYGATAWIP